MAAYLVLIALGPVQDFIMTARRTRDLWFGSYLLSECSKATAKALKEAGAELIFPNPTDSEKDLDPNKPDELNVCNIILAQCTTANEHDALEIAKQAKQAARDRLLEMFDMSLNDTWRVPKIDAKNARIQVEDMLEVYCAVTEIGNDYPAARDRVNAAIAARKATRDFVQPSWSKAGVPKSSLDGARESITPDNERHLARLGLRRGERLCGVGLLKRLGMRGVDKSDQKRFASTSTIAAEIIETDASKTELETYFGFVNSLRSINELETPEAVASDTPEARIPDIGDITGAALFENRLEELLDIGSKNEKLTCEEKEDLKTRISSAKTALFELLNRLGVKQKTLLPYYAILLADGDNMGIALDHVSEIDKHKEFSRDLAGFAREAGEIVEKAQGTLIYAGGDDVLALLPLHTALDCVQCLSNAFNKAVAKTTYYTKTKPPNLPSLSAGMVVWHHLEPLQEGLETARKAEKIAKDVPGKNALCIAVCKRSGADLIVKDKLKVLVDRLQRIIESQNAEPTQIPKGAAYELRELNRDLGHIPPAQLAEAKRILKRKQGDKSEIEEVFKNLEKADKEAREQFDKHQKESPDNQTTTLEQYTSAAFMEIVNELIAAQIFADATRRRKEIQDFAARGAL